MLLFSRACSIIVFKDWVKLALKKKKKFERRQNIEGVFKINNPSIKKNKHVLLVDDVITKGAKIDVDSIISHQ